MKTNQVKRLTKTLLGLGFCLLLLTSCAAVRPIPPEVNLMSLEVQEITLSHAIMLADLRVFNPNQVDLTVEDVQYVLHLNDIKVVAGRSAFATSVAPQEYGLLTLRLSSAYWNMLSLFNSMQAADEVTYSLEGEIKISGFGPFGQTFPFARQGTIPLQQQNKQLPGAE